MPPLTPTPSKAELLQRKADVVREIRELRDRFSRPNATMTEADAGRVDDLIVERNQVEADLERLNNNPATTTAARPGPAYDRVARVGYEARTYRPDEDPTGKQFLLDVSRNFLYQDPVSLERLQRHAAEERVERPGYQERAVGTGAYSGLVVPQYLTDLYAPAVAALRPFANICNQHVLPSAGMTVNISRITTATSVALQATENTAVSETNIDDTILTENVQTFAGEQTVSRQAIERGTGVEDVTLEDLLKRYATTLDSTLINQATTGLAPISTSQTYTNATVDTTAIPAAWKQVIQAQSSLESVLLAQAPVSHVIMHPRRWNWFCAAISASWPVIAGTNVPPTSWGMQLTSEYGPSVRAVMSNGLKVVVDANISTVCLAQATSGGTQDHIYVVAADECHLWERPRGPNVYQG